jgi:NADP-reducing hydrogenase subunit HndB
MTLQNLRALREALKGALARRFSGDKTIEITLGMGTCGIAAGAKETLEAFVNELKTSAVQNVVIKPTGCMGFCHSEPTALVRMEGMPDTIYGNVDEKTARRIVQNHILEKKLVDGHVFDRPSRDILKET